MKKFNFTKLLLLVISGIPATGFILGLTDVVNPRLYVLYVILPAIVLVLGLAIVNRKKDPLLFKKIMISVWIGILATFALDIFRVGVASTFTHIVQDDDVLGIGTAIFNGVGHSESVETKEVSSVEGTEETEHTENETEKNASLEESHKEPSIAANKEDIHQNKESNAGIAAKVIGYGYHYLNGISFTLAFILLLGYMRSIASGVVFGIVIWIIMWIVPPEMTALGYFGSKTGGPGLAFITLAGHIAFGLVIGYFTKLVLNKSIKNGMKMV